MSWLRVRQERWMDGSKKLRERRRAKFAEGRTDAGKELAKDEEED